MKCFRKGIIIIKSVQEKIPYLPRPLTAKVWD